jgi:Mrp family chromosome partitioning ATPase
MMDCDWRNPQLHQILRCSTGPGLAELLTDNEALLNACFHRDKQSGADVIPAGAWDSRATHLLRSERMAELLALLASTYDVILLDCPPVLVTADALALSRLAHKVVYVVRWGHTPQEAVTEGLKQFYDAQADIAGVAVSRVVVKEYRRHSYRDLTYNYARASVATFR